MPLYAVFWFGVPSMRPFGARAVVADDVDDERVVELPHVLHGLDHAADLIVGVRRVAGEDLGLARVEPLLDRRERVPLGEDPPARA